MSRHVSPLLAAVVLLLAGLTHARAAWHATVSTESDSGVVIEVTSPFDHAPPTGYLPLWVTIRNSSGAARTWNFIGDGDDPLGDTGNKHVTTESLHVENGQSARFLILLPMDGLASGYYYRTHSFEIEGYGVSARQTSLPGVNTTTKSTPTPALGMSEDLATPIWAGLTKWYTDDGKDLVGSPVDLGLLGGDWRALVGLDTLWLSDAGYLSLDASRRGVIRDWVNQGGWLCLCAQGADPSLRAALGLPETGDTADIGLGRVQLLPWDGKPLTLDRVTGLSYPFPSKRGEPGTEAAEEWPLTKAVGEIRINTPLLIAFITAFALVVGPLNLFVFANSARRHRLFWTTPLISVAASLLLMVSILLQDGFGGAGQRVMVCLLLPDQKKIVVIQEQVARTGVLLSRQFQTTEDLVLSPMHLGGRSPHSYRQTGRNYSGDWFASRSVQAHRAQAVVPSRAEIQLLNADAARDGAPPVVTSSVPAALKEIQYLDAAGHRWVGNDLRTGERITLHPSGAEDALVLPDLGGSATLLHATERFVKTRGCFVALASDGPFIDTLASVHWDKQTAVFAGPVTSAR